VGTEKEIAVWDGKAFENMTPTNGDPELAVRDVAVGRDGTFWVRTDNELRKCANRSWLGEAQDWAEVSQPSTRPLEMFGDMQGGVWVRNYGNGLWHVDRDGRAARVGLQQGLPNTLIECWCEDCEGNIWVGLTDGGLACVRPRIFHPVWPEEDVQNRSTRSVCEDADGAMWFGSARQEVLRWREGKFTSFTPPEDPSAGFETSVLPAEPGRLWVGTACNGLWMLENGEFARPFPSGDIGTVVRCLYRDRRGALWIGSEFGLYRRDEGVLKKFSPADGFAPAYVLSIAEDPAGDLWFGTAAGELRRRHAGKFESFRPLDFSSGTNSLRAGNGSDAGAFPGAGANFGRERFWALHCDADGVLWIGTLGGGLLRFKDGVFTRFTPREGLPNEHISQILEDDHGQLWLGTRAGIVRVAKSDLTAFARGSNGPVNFIAYGKYDGLPTLECSGGIQPGCWKSRDGRLWFSTVKGPVWVDPSALHFNRRPPPVELEEALVDGERMTEDPAAPSQLGGRVPNPMRIAAGRHHFEFRFSALSFTSPDKVKFRWRLSGLESDWVEGGARHTASYSYLPPGKYRFEVRACNNDGVWNESGVAAPLIVLPYFWQTWWFEVACGLALAALLLSAYTIRIARLRVLEKLRLRIARDLHDEVGANLGSISLLAQMMEHTPTRADAIQVRSLAVQTMDTLRDIVWFIDPTHDRLSDLVIRMQETSRTMLQAVEFKFDQAGDFESKDVPLVFRRNVLPLFKEALHNLLKHSRATQVEISVRRDGENFQFRIHDNGIGFDPRQKTAGNGLKNMKRRAAEIGGRIEFESRSGGGATVTLTAPITQIRDLW
jgi:signal transduction histidine kinase/streptogramin lyase